MILDSKEIEIEVPVSDDRKSIESVSVDSEGLERGERYIRVPEGVEEICAGSFDEYNNGPVAANIMSMLLRYEDEVAEQSKRLTRKQLIKIQFPEEAGTTIREKSEYLVTKDLRVRILRLSLPASLNKIPSSAFPVLMESINVSPKNRSFSSVNGILFNKEGNTLIRFPGYIGDRTYVVPQGTEVIEENAFAGSYIKKVVIPSSIKCIKENAFAGSVISEIEFGEGITEIRKESLKGCNVEKIIIPSTVRNIEDYAFAETGGIKEIACNSDDISLGACIFSKGKYNDIRWWPWDVISKAAFLNAHIASITIPAGVKAIEDYAFAGCYMAKKVIIPDSVTEIGPRSFDMGYAYHSDISMPEHLYKYIYRFPVMSRINRKEKNKLWDLSYSEDEEVLRRYLDSIGKINATLKSTQVAARRSMRKELDLLNRIMT